MTLKNFWMRVNRKIAWIRDRVNFSRRRAVAKRKFRKLPAPAGKHFWMLCVRKVEYVKLVLDNVNSLHACNPSHKMSIFCDGATEAALKKLRFDYKTRVQIVKGFADDDARAWQFLKLDSVFECTKTGATHIDADTVWWDDPEFDSSRIVLQTRNGAIQEWPDEAKLVELLGRREWGKLSHFVTGFVNIPNSLWDKEKQAFTMDLALRIFDIAKKQTKVFQNPEGVGRLCEELALGLALQHFHSQSITTLKDSDPYGDKNVMESLYYGALRGI